MVIECINMRKITAVGVVIILLGGLIMPVGGKPIQFMLCLDGPEEYISNVEVFLEGEYIGRTDEEGCVNCIANTRDNSHSVGVNFTFKKEGYRNQSGGMMVYDEWAVRTLIVSPLEVPQEKIGRAHV